MITSLAFLHGRRVHLNVVADGFKNDREALNDQTPYDQRYERLTEYTAIVQQLLQSAEPVSFSGSCYQVCNLRLTPPLPRDLSPRILMSSSSDAGIETARRMGATAIEYPRPAAGYAKAPSCVGRGLRIGIITRDTDTNAWCVAHTLFPEDRRVQLTQQLAMKASDSSWHRQLSHRSRIRSEEHNPYWLAPIGNYTTFCPYLVGSYVKVSDTLACYLNAGYRTFILDVPPSAEEMRHIRIVFGLASDAVAA
jgi:alkanesulfonate monooxygenase